MSIDGTLEGQGGTLTGRAPAARIFALVILSLVVLLGSLLAVRAIGQHEAGTAVTAQPHAAKADGSSVLVVPKDEAPPAAKPKAAPKPQRKAQTTQSAPASSSSTPVGSAAPVQATPTPTPTPAPVQAAPTPAPAPKAAAPAAKKAAPVQHTVVVTE